MKILELHIIQFSRFSDKTFSFSDGFNIIEGKNESGKSTLQAFIKFMLYGLPRRNPNVLIGERERALSWLGQSAAGSLTVEQGGAKYRIERAGSIGARGAYSEKCKMIDLADGSEVFENDVPGEILLGIDAAAYDSMCNVKQLECTGVDADAVKGALENLLSSGDENTSVDSALKMLDKERVRLLHKSGRGGLVYDAERELERLESELAVAISREEENIKHRSELERTERQLVILNKEYDISSKKCDLFEDVGRLEKFRRLDALKKENEDYSNEIAELDNQYGIVGTPPTYEELAEMKGAAESLERCEERLADAKAESEMAKARRKELSPVVSDELEFLLYEFSTPQNIINNLNAKKKKKVGEIATCLVAFAAALVLFGGAIWLAILKDLLAGAITVAFFGVIAAVVGLIFASRAQKTKKALAALISRIDKNLSERDIAKIRELLERFDRDAQERRENDQANDSAAVKLAMAEESCSLARDAAIKLLVKYSPDAESENVASTLLSLSESLREYLGKRAAPSTSYKENDILIRSLRSELERYDQKVLEKKITPEIEAAIKASSFDRLKIERDAALYKINELNRYKAELERRLGSIEGAGKAPNDIFPELEKQKKRLAALKVQCSAITLAMEKIDEAAQKLKNSIFPRIKHSAQKNMALMTDGKYSELFLDDKMALSVLADGQTRPIDALSKGSCDVAYFSVRLALLETTCEENKPPLILDEALSQLDDGRAALALSAIARYCTDGGQALLFTCQTRDALLAKTVAKIEIFEL